MLTYGSATYTYRADGLRASDGTGSSKKYYLYDGGNAICRLDSAGNLDRTYVFAPDGLVGWSIPGSTSHQMLFDWQGNLEHSTSATGNVATSHAYNAWGQRNSVFPINAVTGANDRFGYNARWGYVRDTTGLYYCQNRYYDPANGRWLNRDPIGYAGGMNLYGYCGGGPVGAVDRDGRAIETLWDIANVGMGLWDLGSALLDGDWEGAAVAGGGLLIDLAATALPGVPGGAGAARRGGKALAAIPTQPASTVARNSIAEGGSCSTLFRYGTFSERTSDLAKDAARAEAAGMGHGLSVNSKPHPKGKHRVADKSEVEKVFEVRATPTAANPGHHTVILPNPITPDITKAWNDLFKRP